MSKEELTTVIDILEGAIFDEPDWIHEYSDTRRDFWDADEKDQTTRLNNNADTLCSIEKDVLAKCRKAIAEHFHLGIRGRK